VIAMPEGKLYPPHGIDHMLVHGMVERGALCSDTGLCRLADSGRRQGFRRLADWHRLCRRPAHR
jgi:hypothetical protein